jgi:hypothetical protein
MPSGTDWARVQVHPGRGLITRHGETVLVVSLTPTSRPERIRELVELCRPDPTGPARMPALRALLDLHSSAKMPGFALLIHTGGSLRALLHGPVRVLVDGRPQGPPGSGGIGRLTEHLLEDGAWHGVTVLADSTRAAGDAMPPDVTDVLPFHLESGTVPGAGVTLHRVRPEQPAAEVVAKGAREVAPSPTSSTALRPVVQFRTVLLGECAARAPRGRGAWGRRRPPLPVAGAPGERALPTAATGPEVLVEGVLCPDGHFTDPDLLTCRTCGTQLAPDGPRVSRPRPPLGLLVTDGGTIYPVTGDLVIGRETEQAPDVLAGRARPLPLRDAARSTSRVHARLTLEGWKVLLSDSDSANGTLVSHHGAAGPWLPVMPGAPMPLLHGDRVRLGKRQLLFDTWRETVVPQVSR